MLLCKVSKRNTICWFFSSGIQIDLISGALIMSSPGMRVREQISVLCPASQLGDVFMQFCITNHDAAVQWH